MYKTVQKTANFLRDFCKNCKKKNYIEEWNLKNLEKLKKIGVLQLKKCFFAKWTKWTK